jgi:hypothetical protein
MVPSSKPANCRSGNSARRDQRMSWMVIPRLGSLQLRPGVTTGVALHARARVAADEGSRKGIRLDRP